MNISIFVFGNDKFIATLPKQIRDTDVFSVETSANLNLMVSRIQNVPPDVILVQASQDGSMELCHWLKEQTKLSWIYCILLEDRPQLLETSAQQDWEWELDITCTAFRQGADAYIWYNPSKGDINSDNTDNSEFIISHRLLLAQLTVGLRKAQKYRDLIHANDVLTGKYQNLTRTNDALSAKCQDLIRTNDALSRKYEDLIRTNDVLSAIALADSLTDFNNRRALEWDLPKQIEKARTSGKPLSLIILDVDYFKKVNDNHGHLVGDRLLQLLCSRLRYNFRSLDTPFRYGGEEFVILLSDTTSEEAYKVAYRLKRVVSEEPFTINNNLAIKITISLGTASLQSEDDPNGISLLDRADGCLLQAKSSGRNRVICSCESTPNPQPQTSHLRVV